MKKKELRKVVLDERRTLSEEDIATLTDQLLIQFAQIDLSSIETIHIFLPIIKKNEPDTFRFISWLEVYYPHVTIVVPKADFQKRVMTSHIYKGKSCLIQSEFDISEPNGEFPYFGRIDMIIVPLLAFDLQGYRVGYGKGFYDRFLQHLKTCKVGLSFNSPVQSIEDVTANDIKLDICITPERVYRFNL